MQKRIIMIFLIILGLCATAYAGTSIFQAYSIMCTPEAQEAAMSAQIPPSILSSEEENLFRLGYACGYDDALANEITRSYHLEPTYIVNLMTKKFHDPSCYMVNSILFENREDLYCTYEEAILKGYSPCGKCNPK